MKRKTAVQITVLLLTAALIGVLLMGCSAQPGAQTGTVRLPAETSAETRSPAPVPESSPAPLAVDAPTSEPEDAPTPAPEPTPEETPPPEPERWELDYAAQQAAVTVSLPDEGSIRYLSDGLVGSKHTLAAGTALQITTDIPVSGLYLIWDVPPGPWSLQGEGWNTSFGEYGFLHEFVELPESASLLTLTVTQECVLCDVFAYTDGSLPESVQLWRPPEEQVDLLVFPTHGDDELLFFGGTIPVYAGELGLKVQVVYMTNHWREQPRPHEQLNGLWTAGLTVYPVMSDLRDRLTDTLAEAKAVFQDSFLQFQVQMIRRFKPSVIIGHDVNGEYGHGAHMLNARTLLESVPLAADPAYDPLSAELCGTWDTPKLYLHLYSENQIVMDWDQPLSRFGGMTGFEVAKQAYLQHKSQQQWSFQVYPRNHYYSSYKFGLARSTVGPDIAQNDFLEHVPSRLEAKTADVRIAP